MIVSIQTIFHKYGYTFEDHILKQFALLVERFMEYNSHTNLSAIRDIEGVIEKHCVDSLALLPYLPSTGRIMDLGTGGGFPGLPLAIIRPDLHWTLVDATRKKVDAVRSFADALGLEIETIHDRAEHLATDQTHAGKYQMIVSRSVAYMPTILEWSTPFIYPDGAILLMKSPSNEELRDGAIYLTKHQLHLKQIYDYTLAGQERKILHIVRSL